MDEELTDTKDVTCPYCGNDDDCPHLLAVFDMTFGECNGGLAFDSIPKFLDMTEEAFNKALSAEDRDDVAWDNYWLDEAWQSARSDQSDSGDSPLINSACLFGVLIEIFEEHGAISLDNDFEGGPGMSSACQIAYAEDPAAVLTITEGELRKVLTLST